MKKQNGLEGDFFELWQTISYFFEMQGIYDGEGYSMGLAAARIGMPFNFFREDKFLFFKDNIEKVRVKNGQSSLQDKQIYFDIHKEIEYLKHSLWGKVKNKLSKQVVFYYRLFRLRIFVKEYPNFSKIFASTSKK